MNKNSLVTIIMPTKNRAHLIKKAILSVKKQTFKNWKLLVVNDYSSDNTAAIITTLSKKDNRIQLINNPLKNGISNARNFALTKVDTKYTGFLDDDNEMFPSWIEEIYSYLEMHKDIDACYPILNLYYYYRCKDKTIPLYMNLSYSEFIPELRPNIVTNFFFEGDPNGLIIRTRSVKKMCFSTNIDMYTDYEFLISLLRKKLKISIYGHVLGSYFRVYNPDTKNLGICVNATHADHVRNLEYILKKHEEFFNMFGNNTIKDKIKRYSDYHKKGFTPLDRLLEKYG